MRSVLCFACLTVKPVGSQDGLAHEAEVDRAYVGGLERQEENPTVDILDRLANTLSVPISDFFIAPAKGASPPKPLRSGRRASA